MKTHTVTKNKEGGFTLIETLVGLTVFMIAFVALNQVGSNSLQDINQTKRRLVAQYLAEEGIEYVKQMQKSYILQGKNKTQFFDEFVNPDCSNGCDFYIGNDATSAFGPSMQLGSSSFTTGSSGGAPTGEIGVATSLVTAPSDLSPLRYHQFGLIALDGLYTTDVADSEYSRVVTIEDISTLQSQAIEVTSSVYFSSVNNSGNAGENAVIIRNIMHFNF